MCERCKKITRFIVPWYPAHIHDVGGAMDTNSILFLGDKPNHCLGKSVIS
jgi:hypothetical protein